MNTNRTLELAGVLTEAKSNSLSKKQIAQDAEASFADVKKKLDAISPSTMAKGQYGFQEYKSRKNALDTALTDYMRFVKHFGESHYQKDE